MNWILHHYDFSNFSEKVRLILGFKRVTWDSVEIPAYLPKPDYVPLTGGYRRTPSLQIGADVYCDTRLIADVIESAVPEPGLFPGGARTRVLAHAIADWAESRLLWPAALYITGINAARYPAEFHSDRAVLHGKPLPDVEKVKASAVKYLAQLRSELGAIEDLFAPGQPYVLGDAPGLADIALYHVPWFLDTIEPEHHLLDAMPRTRAWMSRIAAIGHGVPQPLTAAEAIARANETAPKVSKAPWDPNPEGIATGEPVSVSPLDENSPAHGTLVGADDRTICISVRNERVDPVHVHFPRSGYKLSRDRSR